MSVMRTWAVTVPLRVVISVKSDSLLPAASASPSDISAQTSGAAFCRSGARPVLVRVWKGHLSTMVFCQKARCSESLSDAPQSHILLLLFSQQPTHKGNA